MYLTGLFSKQSNCVVPVFKYIDHCLYMYAAHSSNTAQQLVTTVKIFLPMAFSLCNEYTFTELFNATE